MLYTFIKIQIGNLPVTQKSSLFHRVLNPSVKISTIFTGVTSFMVKHRTRYAEWKAGGYSTVFKTYRRTLNFNPPLILLIFFLTSKQISTYLLLILCNLFEPRLHCIKYVNRSIQYESECACHCTHKIRFKCCVCGRLDFGFIHNCPHIILHVFHIVAGRVISEAQNSAVGVVTVHVGAAAWAKRRWNILSSDSVCHKFSALSSPKCAQCCVFCVSGTPCAGRQTTPFATAGPAAECG